MEGWNLNYWQDEVNYWRVYEQTKDKEFINFDKNPEVKERFLLLMVKIKSRCVNA